MGSAPWPAPHSCTSRLSRPPACCRACAASCQRASRRCSAGGCGICRGAPSMHCRQSGSPALQGGWPCPAAARWKMRRGRCASPHCRRHHAPGIYKGRPLQGRGRMRSTRRYRLFPWARLPPSRRSRRRLPLPWHRGPTPQSATLRCRCRSRDAHQGCDRHQSSLH